MGRVLDDLQAVLDSLSPGDVLELASGTYDVGSSLGLDVSGTAQAPITIRGEDRDNVILSGSGTIIQVLRASHVILEDLTLQGTGTDSGGSATSKGVSFWDGTLQEFVDRFPFDPPLYHEPIMVDGHTLRYVHTYRGESYSDAMEFTRTGDLKIANHRQMP